MNLIVFLPLCELLAAFQSLTQLLDQGVQATEMHSAPLKHTPVLLAEGDCV